MRAGVVRWLPGATILDRYTAREFVAPFLATIAGFTVILLTGALFDLTDLVLVKRVEAGKVLAMLAYKLPSLMVITIPIGTLFATLLSLGRLVQDSEMTVMRATGISFSRILAPILLLGLLISIGSYQLNEWVVPAANYRYESLVRQVLYQDAAPAIQENVFFRATPGQWLYVRQVDRRTQELRDVLIYEVRSGGFPNILTARTGRYDGKVWHLEGVVGRELDEQGFVRLEWEVGSQEVVLPDRTEAFLGSQKSTEEMNRRELAEQIQRFRQSGIRVQSLLVDYHIKLSLPFASLIFALSAAPLSLRSTRSGRSFGVAVSLGLAFLYYVIFSISRSLGTNGVLDPVLAAWLPNLAFFAAGLVLLYRAEWSP